MYEIKNWIQMIIFPEHDKEPSVSIKI